MALDRLRKEAAFARLLARFAAVAPDDWALKGGVSLIWRTGQQVRATKDVDANWRRDPAGLEDFLTAVEESDLDDGFTFIIGEGRRLRGEGDDGALRFSVRALLAGRDFERFRLDVNLVPDDPRPVETVKVTRNLFAFAGLDAPTLPMLPAAEQLAEKLHACVRAYADGASSRAKDGFDTVVLAASVPLPEAETMSAALRATFVLRRTPLPAVPPTLPIEWREDLRGFLADYPLEGIARNVDQLIERFGAFWEPLLAGAASGHWHPDSWSWGP